MEFEGTVVSLGNTDIKIKNLMRNVNERENDIRGLKLQLEDMKRLLKEAEDRNVRLVSGRQVEARLKTEKKKARKKYPGMNARPSARVKKEFTPEQRDLLRANMAKAREKRKQLYLARQEGLRPET